MRAWQFPGRPSLALADCRRGELLTSQRVEHVGVNNHKGKVAPLPSLYFTISRNKMQMTNPSNLTAKFKYARKSLINTNIIREKI